MSIKPKEIDGAYSVRGEKGYFESIDYSKISKITTYPVESKFDEMKKITDDLKASLDSLMQSQAEHETAQDIMNTEFKDMMANMRNATCAALEVQGTLIDMQIDMHKDLVKSKRELRAAKAASWRHSLRR